MGRIYVSVFVVLVCLLPLSVVAAPARPLVGIARIVAHPALDAVEKGIRDELAAQRVDVTYDLQNANGDIGTAASIAAKFKAERVSLAVGIATPTAQALVNGLKRTPVVFAAVTDPVQAGLVRSLSRGERYVTGVSDMTPVKQQIALLLKMKKVRRLGHIYTSSEENAVVLAGIVRQVCRELGIEYVETTVSRSAEVKRALQAIIRRVDALYVSTDNTVISAMGAVTDVALKHRIPVMSADPSSARTYPVLAAWGFDYYRMGRATGRLVAEILRGKRPDQIPTRFMTDPADMDLVVNLDVARTLGLTVPPSVVKSAGTVIDQGQVGKK